MKNNLKNKKLILWVLIVTLICVLVGTGIGVTVYLVNKHNDNSPVDNGDNKDNNDDNNDDGKTVKEFRIISGLKSEYYLNEDFDLNKIELLVKYKTDSGIITKYLNAGVEFLKGYPETSVPNTSTLGNVTFTLIYLDGEINAGFKVVEFNETHTLLEMLNRTYISENSMFSKMLFDNGINLNQSAKEFLNLMYDKTVAEEKPKVFGYANVIYNFLNVYNLSGSVESFNNPENVESEKAYITKNGNETSGGLWTNISEAFEFVEFNLTYNNSNNGICFDIINDGTTAKIISNYNDKKFNLCVVCDYEYDIIFNYTENKFLIATTTKNSNNNLNSLSYNENFGYDESFITSIEYNVQNNTFNFYN